MRAVFRQNQNVDGRITFHAGAKELRVFRQQYLDFEQNVKRAFLKLGIEGGEEIFDTSINLGDILRQIPKNQRQRLLAEYESIIKLENMVDFINFDPGTGTRPTTEYRTSTGSLHKFNVDLQPDPNNNNRLNPLAVIYNRATVQESASGKMTTGSNIMKYSFLENLLETNNVIATGQKIFVLDVETGSLSTGAIREFAGTRLDVNAQGVIDSPSDVTFHRHLKTSQMRIGSIADNSGKAINLEDAIQSKLGFNYVAGDPQDGARFAQIVSDLIDSVDIGNPESRLAGQNLQFDLQQILVSVKQTHAYKTGGSFQAKINQFENWVSQQGKIIDTLELARINLPDVKVAPETAFFRSTSTHSIENLLYQTNLVDLIVQDINGGVNGFLDMIRGPGGGGGVHGAATDVNIEAYLLKFLTDPNSGLRADNRDRGYRAIDADEFAPIRQVFKESYAYTPVSRIKDIDDITPQTLVRLHELGRIRVDQQTTVAEPTLPSGRFDPQIPTGTRSVADKDQAIRDAIGNSTRDVKFNVTPLQQQNFIEKRGLRRLTNQAATATVDDPSLPVGQRVDNLVRRSRGFSDFVGADFPDEGFMTPEGVLKVGTQLPSMDEYLQFQRQAAAAGDVLAGLSLPERMVTEGMRRATLLNEDVADFLESSPIERQVSSLTENLGVSYFKATDSVYVGESNAVTMSVEVLQNIQEGINQAAQQGASQVSDSPLSKLGTDDYGTRTPGTAPDFQRVRVSTYQFADQTDYGMNIAIDFEDADFRRIADYIENVLNNQGKQAAVDLLGGHSNPQQVISAIRQTAVSQRTPNAISIGFMKGKAAQVANSILEPFSNSSQILSDSTELTFNSSIIDYDADSGMLKLGAFVDESLVTAGEQTLIDDVARQTQEQRRTVIAGVMQGDDAAIKQASQRSTSLGRTTQSAIDNSRLVEAGKRFGRALPIAGGLVAAAFAGKKLVDNYQERQEVNETFDFQGYETGTDYYNLQQQVESAMISKQRRLDPLATAGLTANMHNIRNDHTRMGPNAHAHLFSGVLI